MKKTKILTLLAAFLLIGGTARAQFMEEAKSRLTSGDQSAWSGLRFSYDRSILKSTADGSDLKQGFNGFTLSYVKSWALMKKLPLFVEAGGGLGFSRHSYDGSENNFTLKVSHNLLGLYVPANVVYKIPVTDKITLKPYTGIYLRLGLIGKEKYEAGVSGYISDDSYSVYGDDGCDWKRFQVGWQIGLTADYDRYNFGIGYGWDFNKLAPDARFNTFSLRVGMNF